MITFFIPIDPVAKGRPKMAANGHVYTPAETRAYEDEIKSLLLKHRRHFAVMFNLPLKITLHFFIKPPKKAVRHYPCVRPDLDNYAKAVLDAMNGIVFKDDGQIITLSISKRYHEVAGTEVTLEVPALPRKGGINGLRSKEEG